MKHQNAFTLVELSIVLVILGLLIGGVLTGQALIRASELRSISTQYGQYMTAVQTFRDKYFALPGDLTNAQSYWGVAHATPATCITTASTTSATCNGDGNGLIQLTAPGSNEVFRFWQHLANAGLIEGQYDGITHGSTAFSATRENSPKGKLSASAWYIMDRDTACCSNSYFFDGVYGNSFQFGRMGPDATPGGTILKPEEMYNIDMKMDDGKPATGKLVIYGNFATCTDTASTSTLTANYLLSNSAISCVLIFRQQF